MPKIVSLNSRKPYVEPLDVTMYRRDKETVHSLVRFLFGRNQDCPFEAIESYDAHSSHSDWREDGIGPMLWYRYPETFDGSRLHFLESIRADPKKVAVAVDLEKWIILADAVSAIHSAIHYKENEERWFHDPFASGWSNLDGYRNDDYRIFKNFFLTHEVLLDNELITKAWHEYDRIFRLYWVPGDGLSTLDDEKKKAYEADIQNLHKFLLGLANTVREQIERNLAEIPENE